MMKSTNPVIGARAGALIEGSAREASTFGHDLIRPEHLLLALVETDDRVVAEILGRLGLQGPLVRQRVIESMSAGTKRVEVVGTYEAAATAAAFEPPIASLTRLAHDGALSEWDEEFVRNTIQQIHLWRQRDEASPQIFELLVADLVKKLLEPLSDPAPLRAELVRLGADHDLADEVSRRVAESVTELTGLGDDDPVVDAALLERIAASTERTAAALEKPMAKRLAEQAALGGAGAVGKGAATAGLHAVSALFTEEWPKIQVGLLLAWRTVKEWFVR